MIEGFEAVLGITAVAFYPQERNRIPEFDMARPDDATECQHLEFLPFLSDAFKIGA